MKTGLPPPPSPRLPTPQQTQQAQQAPQAPPPARTQHTTPAAELAAREAARKAAAGRGDERMMSLNARYTFRHSPTPRRSLPRPGVPLTRRPPPRAQPRPQPQPHASHAAHHSHEPPAARGESLDAERHHAEDDTDSRRRAQEVDAEDRTGSGDSFHPGGDDAEREARRRRAGAKILPRRPQPPATQVLARSGLPAAAALFVRHGPDARDPKQMLQLLAALLVACGEKRSTDPHKPSPTATLLAGLQVHMASQLEAAPDPLSLGEVKALLMDCRSPAGGAPVTDEKLQNTLLLLPLYLLNASRHRTDDQRREAMGRLQQLRNVPGLS